MRNEYSYRENESDLNNYILMYNNNVAQINNLYSMNCILQNNINLIRNTQYRPRARRYARNIAPPPPPPLSVPSSGPLFTHAPTPTPTSSPVTTNLNNTPSLATTRSRHRTNAFGLPLPSATRPIANENENPNPNTNININANINTRTQLRRQTFFDPVIIYPTQTQIENATRFIQYDTITNPSNESCPFTYEPFTNEDMVRQILFCGHICSSVGFNTWFNSNVSCPICRYDIRNYRPTSMFNNEDLVSSFPAPAPAPTTSEAQANTEAQARPLSAFSQLLDIDDDTTDFMIRNYLGFWYDVASTATTTARATTSVPAPSSSNETNATSSPTPQPTTPARNIVYYTIRNLDRHD